MAAVASPTPTAAMARAAGSPLAWPAFTTPIRATDLDGFWEALDVANGRLRRTAEAALAASDMMRFTQALDKRLRARADR
jgi:hypothetical protein